MEDLADHQPDREVNPYVSLEDPRSRYGEQEERPDDIHHGQIQESNRVVARSRFSSYVSIWTAHCIKQT